MPGLEDFADAPSFILGAVPEAVRRLPAIALAESAFHAPFASFGGVPAKARRTREQRPANCQPCRPRPRWMRPPRVPVAGCARRARCGSARTRRPTGRRPPPRPASAAGAPIDDRARLLLDARDYRAQRLVAGGEEPVAHRLGVAAGVDDADARRRPPRTADQLDVRRVRVGERKYAGEHVVAG